MYISTLSLSLTFETSIKGKTLNQVGNFKCNLKGIVSFRITTTNLIFIRLKSNDTFCDFCIFFFNAKEIPPYSTFHQMVKFKTACKTHPKARIQ